MSESGEIRFDHCYEAETAALNQNRDLLIATLAQLEIVSMQIRYSGGGDSGDVYEVEPEPACAVEKLRGTTMAVSCAKTVWDEARKASYTLETHSVSVDEALRDFALAWVDQHHGGWENNDGGSGTVTINVVGNTFVLEHDAYYTESFHHEHSL